MNVSTFFVMNVFLWQNTTIADRVLSCSHVSFISSLLAQGKKESATRF